MGIVGDGVELLRLVNVGVNSDLYSKLATWIDKVAALQTEVEKLQESNKSLREQLQFRGTVIRVGPCAYVDGDDEPICMHCADVDNFPVHIWEQYVPGRGLTPVCPRCKNHNRYCIKRSRAEQLAKEGKI
jgi:hypothetical protein